MKLKAIGKKQLLASFHSVNPHLEQNSKKKQKKIDVYHLRGNNRVTKGAHQRSVEAHPTYTNKNGAILDYANFSNYSSI